MYIIIPFKHGKYVLNKLFSKSVKWLKYINIFPSVGIKYTDVIPQTKVQNKFFLYFPCKKDLRNIFAQLKERYKVAYDILLFIIVTEGNWCYLLFVKGLFLKPEVFASKYVSICSMSCNEHILFTYARNFAVFVLWQKVFL